MLQSSPAPVAVAVAAGIKLVGVPQTKSIHGFSPNFQSLFMQEDLELVRFWGHPVTTVALETLFTFLGLKVCWCSTA